MSLPQPPAKKRRDEQITTSMLEKNREVELAQEQVEALALPETPIIATSKFTVSPIRQDTLDAFEEIYLRLRKQKRSLKRYHVAEALLVAMVEEPTVLAEVVKRLR